MEARFGGDVIVRRCGRIVLVAGLAVSTAMGVSCQTPAPALQVRVDALAPGFTLPVAGGDDAVTLADELARNKLTVVMFIATQCPVSNAYNTRMAALARAYKGQGVGFIGVNSNKQESAEEAAAHAESNGFAFPVVKDHGNKVADLYGARVTPEVFLVEPSGRVRYHGRVDENQGARADDDVKSPDLRRALDALLAGQSPPASETKAFGCSIKRL